MALDTLQVDKLEAVRSSRGRRERNNSSTELTSSNNLRQILQKLGEEFLNKGKWEKGGFKELKEDYSPAQEL